MSDISRRAFVATASTAASVSRILGGNDRIRLGIVGAGGRGTYLMREAGRELDIEWAAVCDAWDHRRGSWWTTPSGGPREDWISDSCN